MDLTCFNWIQLIKKSDLPANARHIAHYLSTFMNMEHRIAWPSQSRIAEETGLSARTVIRQIKILADKEWIVVKKASIKSTQNVSRESKNHAQEYLHNVYQITIPEAVLSTIRGDILSLGPNNRGDTEGNRGDKTDVTGVTRCHSNNNNNNNTNNNKQKPANTDRSKVGHPFSHAHATSADDIVKGYRDDVKKASSKELAQEKINRAREIAQNAITHAYQSQRLKN